ncbi:hypothetical protein ACFPMF_10150 [Larkinella bovis]|uniref:Uncharacterized protein n=1 Tax=Larkinella bovis TaxID=683041 RepID=A0ABW0I8S3_9BACT
MGLLSKSAFVKFILILGMSLVPCEKGGQPIRQDAPLEGKTGRTSDPFPMPDGPLLIAPTEVDQLLPFDSEPNNHRV